MNAIRNSNVTVMVKSMDRSVRFYTRTLGFKLKSRYGNYWAEVKAPGLTIGLHPIGKKVKVGDNLSMGFGVQDFRKAVKTLEKKGIRFREYDDEWVRLAYFHDPDKNVLYLVETKK